MTRKTTFIGGIVALAIVLVTIFAAQSPDSRSLRGQSSGSAHSACGEVTFTFNITYVLDNPKTVKFPGQTIQNGGTIQLTQNGSPIDDPPFVLTATSLVARRDARGFVEFMAKSYKHFRRVHGTITIKNGTFTEFLSHTVSPAPTNTMEDQPGEQNIDGSKDVIGYSGNVATFRMFYTIPGDDFTLYYKSDCAGSSNSASSHSGSAHSASSGAASAQSAASQSSAGGSASSSTPADPDLCEGVCGDGQIVLEEECDDRNTLNGDGCSSNCTIEGGSSSSTGSKQSSSDRGGESGGSSSRSMTSGNSSSSAAASSTSGTGGNSSSGAGGGNSSSSKAAGQSSMSGTAGSNGSTGSATGGTSSGGGDSTAQDNPDLVFGNIHAECRNQQCVTVRGTGDSECRTNADCVPIFLSFSAYYPAAQQTPSPVQEDGTLCLNDTECQTALCTNGRCVTCTKDTDCKSGTCTSGSCTGTCGNGLIEAREQCDAADSNSDTLPDRCRSDCTRPACGDGVQDADEQCDDGNQNQSDGCDSDCRQIRSVVVDLPAPFPDLTATATPSPVQVAAIQDQWAQTGQQNYQQAQLRGISTSHPPSGETGPVTIAVMASGAAAGWAFIRRKRTAR